MLATSDSERFRSSPKRPFETLETEIRKVSSSSSASPKRSKTLTPSPCLPPPPPSNGKSAVEEDEPGSCGICFLEQGKALRGLIDCCGHYFCYFCIVEWSKVESRCPICKRRFSTVRHPAGGAFLSERVVGVPVRDQVYHVDGNATVGPPNLYSEVSCSICNGRGDDWLLLLCDLCDSAAHTYCVGLGHTVPEDDWFCHDCTLVRNEHAKCGTEDNFESQTSLANHNKKQLFESHVSIRDVVREGTLRENARLFIEREREEESTSGGASSRDPSNGLTSGGASSRDPSNGLTPTSSVARTWKHHRNVQMRVQELRKNWNSYQNGSLRFSSSLHHKFDDHSFSRISTPGSTPEKDVSKRNLYDVDKTWKMMDAAKLIRRPGGGSSVRHCSDGSSKKASTITRSLEIGSNLLRPNGETRGNKNSGARESYHRCLPNQYGEKFKRNMFEKEEQTSSTFYRKLPISKIVEVAELPISRNVEMSIETEKHHGNSSCQLLKNPFGAVFIRSLSTSSKLSRAKQELDASSNCSSGRKSRPERELGDCNFKKGDSKSEIQSLVKLNLKLLSGDKKLGADAFKEVARHATHSVLAACGLERPRPSFRSFPSSVCSHVDEVHGSRRSTLMTTCCRGCFSFFVKDVVHVILHDNPACSLA